MGYGMVNSGFGTSTGNGNNQGAFGANLVDLFNKLDQLRNLVPPNPNPGGPTASGIEQKLDAINTTLGTMNGKLDTIAERIGQKFKPPERPSDDIPNPPKSTSLRVAPLDEKVIAQAIAEKLRGSLSADLRTQIQSLRDELRGELRTIAREAVAEARQAESGAGTEPANNQSAKAASSTTK